MHNFYILALVDRLRGSQGGTELYDIFSPVVLGKDGSMVLAGYTFGDWAAGNAGEEDFAAVKLDSDGVELWRWQVGP